MPGVAVIKRNLNFFTLKFATTTTSIKPANGEREIKIYTSSTKTEICCHCENFQKYKWEEKCTFKHPKKEINKDNENGMKEQWRYNNKHK